MTNAWMKGVRSVAFALCALPFAAVAEELPVVAYWRFDPSDPLADSSGNGYTLVYSASDHTDVANYKGMFHFGANPGCSLKTSTKLAVSSYAALTLEAFVRHTPEATTAPIADQSFVGNSAYKAGYSGLLTPRLGYSRGGFVTSRLWVGGASGTSYTQADSSVGKMKDMDWHHVAGVFKVLEDSKKEISVYLDGTLVSCKTNANTTITQFASTVYEVGSAPDGGVFRGDLADVRITGCALDPGQFLSAPTVEEEDAEGKVVLTDATDLTEGADAVVPADRTVTLSASTPRLASLTVAGVLMFEGWETKLAADSVTVLPGGIITAKGPYYGSAENPSNRVWIACETLDVQEGGAINVSQRGFAGTVSSAYAAAFGFAGTRQTPGYVCDGPSHGGAGTFAYSGNTGYDMRIYGSAEWPETPGTGGYSGRLSYEPTRFGGHGGGAVMIEATGTVTLNGQITADGESLIPSSNTSQMGGNVTPGTGGSICISCGKIVGSGLISAKGGWTEHTVNCNAAGGGRIALHYGADQAIGDLSGLVVAAEGGVMKGNAYAGADSLATMENHAGAGTIWMTDSRLVSADTLCNFRGRLMNVDSLDFPGDLTIDHWVGIGSDGFTLHVGGDLTISGDEGRLELGVKDFSAHYARYGYLTSTSAWLKVDGSLTIADGGRLDVHAATTNAVNPYDEGAYVVVGGDLVVGATGKLYPFSSPANGASVDIRAQNITIEEGGVIGLAGAGFAGGYYGQGFGPGAGSSTAIGAGYGGAGGNLGTQTTYGMVYGDAVRPVIAGSGGGAGYYMNGGCGGGFVHLVAANALVVNGKICADGTQPAVYNKGSTAGSGGTILLDGLTFSAGANAQITAKGGAAASTTSWAAEGARAPAGGGGRIAVWTGKALWTPEMKKSRYTVSDVVPTEWADIFSVAGGAKTVDDERHFAGEDGTIRFVTVKGLQGLMLLLK